jgi:SNF2 family DNA or RNA helicase
MKQVNDVYYGFDKAEKGRDRTGIIKLVPEPYEHQVESFHFVQHKDQFALFMEQGTGKSKVIIMKIDMLYQVKKIDRVIIISPNALKRQWVYEQFEEHYPGIFSSCIWNNKKTQKFERSFDIFCNKDHLKVFSINVEAFQSKRIHEYIKRFLRTGEVFIIVDESTTIKNSKAVRTKTIVKGFKNRKYKAILTGTPTPNSPFDLYSQFDFLQNNYFKMSYHHFTHRYGIMMTMTNHVSERDFSTTMDEETFNNIKYALSKLKMIDNFEVEKLSVKYKTSMSNIITIKSMIKYDPYKNLKELNESIDKCTFKIKKVDCLDLPDKVYETLEVELNKDQRKIYEQLQREMVAEYRGKELTLVNKLSMTIRLQQVTGGQFPYPEIIIKKIMNEDGIKEELLTTAFKTKPIENSPKIKALKEDIECVDQNTSIIIWAVFIAELKMIYNELKDKYSCGLCIGETSQDERERIVNEFKNKQIQILIISPAIGERGLNLQVSTLHYFYSNDYRADRRLQAEDRSHRIGQTNKVTYKDIICIDSIDQKIHRVLKRKESLIDFFRNKSIEQIIY